MSGISSTRPSPGPGELAQWNRQALQALRWQWIGVLAVYLVAWLGTYGWLSRSADFSGAARWLVMAGLLLALVLGILWRALSQNHRPHQKALLPSLGYGNGLSLVRGLLVGLLAGFLFSPRPTGSLAWMPALLITFTRLIDHVDGYVARITQGETRLGALLDIELDGLDVLVAVALGIQYGVLPLWYLPLAFSRQLFVAGLWLRRRQGLPIYPLPESENRRLIAGFQTGFLSVVLWPILSPPVTTLASVLFALPLLASFGRDWLVVSGLVDGSSPAYHTARRRLKAMLEGWMPLAARAVGLVAGGAILGQAFPDFASWRNTLAEMGVALSPSILGGLAVVLLLAFALGVVGRVAALALIALACLDIWATGFRWWVNVPLLVSAILVAHWGSGLAALWQPEERLLQTQLGVPSPAEAE
ncbi:CDP-alcohol phosphatidyltransferase family protein [Litorilinea aerophila]|uniref:CDP-alcohol phosphatidyltransferase family protein n=1 Tax=Litorilinea aerophila TaxID=1204385 RepID=UPI0014774C1E|nr:CDP-alcohol phosphatidyltransferase family protein [Litorilinea aerophila]MCC9076149.1 CDP-alcohol phosphatidyltransferase family protein [Litorilinea aerophila]